MIWNTHTTYKLQQTLPLLRYIYQEITYILFAFDFCTFNLSGWFFKMFCFTHKGQVETNPKVLLRSQTICTSSICTIMVKIYYFYLYIYISYKPFLMLSFYQSFNSIKMITYFVPYVHLILLYLSHYQMKCFKTWTTTMF